MANLCYLLGENKNPCRILLPSAAGYTFYHTRIGNRAITSAANSVIPTAAAMKAFINYLPPKTYLCRI